VTALVTSGLNQPEGLAVDGAGNVYIADTGNGVIKELPHVFVGPSPRLESMADGQDSIVVLPANASLNAPFAPTSDQAWLTITGVTNGVVGFAFTGTTSNRVAHVNLLGLSIPVAQESYFLSANALSEGAAAGSDMIVLTVNTLANQAWTASANAAWLHLNPGDQSGTGSATVVFSFDSNVGAARTGTLTIAGQTLTITQGGPLSVTLGTTSLALGPAAGSNSVVLGLPPPGWPWTATANTNWLHISPWNQNGASSTNVIFSFDANPGPTRSGTLTIAGNTVTVTQAGSNYVAAGPTTLISSGLSSAAALAVDEAGNLYIADVGFKVIDKLNVSNSSLTTLVSSGLSSPNGVAVDVMGNVYIADTAEHVIKEWSQVNSNLTTLISSGISGPTLLALDAAKDLFIVDATVGTVYEWSASQNTLINLGASILSDPTGLAVDAAGNAYVSDWDNVVIYKWTAPTGPLSGIFGWNSRPSGIAVDGGGNIYVAGGYPTVSEWMAANGSSPVLVSGVSSPSDVAVDGKGNLYIINGNVAIEELPAAFIDTNAISEAWSVGSDTLPAVVPATANLSGPLTPTSDQTWLTINGATNGIVSVSFTSNIFLPRTAHITLLGKSNSVTQAGVSTYSLSATNIAEAAAAGSDSVALIVAPNIGGWTATANNSWLHLSKSGFGSTNVVFSFDANPGGVRLGTLTIGGQTLNVIQLGPISVGASTLLEGPLAGSDSVTIGGIANPFAWTANANATWLHLSPANQSGTGSTNVIFSYDANPGPTRSGTLAIANQTVTVTQAGSTYVSVENVSLLSSFGSGPESVAVDGAGNLYVGADYVGPFPFEFPYYAIYERIASSGAISTLLSAGSGSIDGLAADGAGNVYFLTGAPNLGEWMASNDAVTGLVSSASGLGGPCGVAANAAGDVYIADSAYNSVQVVFAASTNLVPLITTELNSPEGVALDGAGNVYIADTGDNAVKEWSPANNALIDLVSSNLNAPQSLAVDGSGNVYIADTGDNAIKERMPASNVVITLLSGLNNPVGVAVDVSGNVYEVEGMFFESYPNQFSGDVKELCRAFVDPSLRLESLAAGSDSLPPVLPLTQNLLGPFAPVSRDPWLTIMGVANGVVSFSFSAASSNRTGYIEMLGQTIPVAQGSETFKYTLGTTALLEGPGAGTDSVLLGVNPFFGPWTASANAPWLHFTPANKSGPGSTNVVFTFDANPGAPRTGTLTIAGQTLSVTQAGSTYVAAGQLTTLVTSNQNTPLSGPRGIAVDNLGNIYIADSGDAMIKEWNPSNQTLAILLSSNSTVPLNTPWGIAADGAGNLYVTDAGDGTILKWSAATSNVTTMVSLGLSSAVGVAVDNLGNVYFTDFYNSAIKEWVPGFTNITTLVNEVSTYGVTVDAAGNVYWIAYEAYSATGEWLASTATASVLMSTGLFFPVGATVDGSGNLYIADTSIYKWTANTGDLAPLVSTGLGYPDTTAVDSAGNLYIADAQSNTIKELPRAFVDATPRLEGAGAGSDFLAVVLPATENLLGPFTPTSDQPWLTITGVSNGVISCSFTSTSTNRMAVITVLGQSIPVTQTTNTFLFATNAILAGAAAGSASVMLEVYPNTAAWTAAANVSWLHLSLASQSGTGSANLVFSYDPNPGAIRSGTISVGGQTLTVTQIASVVSLGANSLLEGPTAGMDSVILVVSPSSAPWTATPNAAWLHLSLASQGGTGSTNLVFSFDSNPSATRTGTMSIAGQTLTVAQAGSTYVPAGIVTTLIALGLDAPRGVAATGQSHVYFADTFNNAIKMWTAADNSVTTLLATGLDNPCGISTDGAGNIYFADSGHNAIKVCTTASGNVTSLVSSGLSAPQGVAVDGSGNVYIADTGNGAIKEWMAANGTVTTLVFSGLSYPTGVAVDVAGNVYIADSGHNAIKEWAAANSNVTSLVATGLNSPGAVAVDGSGNVYIADTGNGAIKKWTAASNTVDLLVSSGLSYPYGVGVDSAGNLYIADTDNQAIKELPRAFADPTPKLESLTAGTDVLPTVLPATTDLLPPFAPIAGRPWLMIGGIANGVIDFDFTATSANRTANITLLGQIISVSQSAIGTSPTLMSVQMLAEGVLQFAFTNNSSGVFTVVSSTNLSLPLSNWTVVGTATNTAPGQFQFTSQPTTNDADRYFVVRSP
jgi:streptogramin lyase